MDSFDKKLYDYKQKLQEAIAAGVEVQWDILLRNDGAMGYRSEYRARLMTSVVQVADARSSID